MAPIWPFPATISIWSLIVEITGFVVFSSNSAELASSIPAMLRAASITMHCNPKQRPRVGILFSRAYLSAPSFPSIPRTPKPPGTQIASTSPRLAAASLSVAQLSLGTHLIFTLA